MLSIVNIGEWTELVVQGEAGVKGVEVGRSEQTFERLRKPDLGREMYGSKGEKSILALWFQILNANSVTCR